MGHHDGHHHQGHDYLEEQQYGAHPGCNFGSYEASTSYTPPPVNSYGYQQQPLGYGDYGSVPSVPYNAVQPYGGHGYLQPSYGGAIQPCTQESQIEHYKADEQSHRTNEHKGNTGAFGAAAFAVYEHWMEEKLTEVTAVEKERQVAEINMTEVVNRRKERRNVKLSTDPNSVAARKRRNKKSDKDQILRVLVPECKDESKVPIPLLYDRTRSFVLHLQALLQKQSNV